MIPVIITLCFIAALVAIIFWFLAPEVKAAPVSYAPAPISIDIERLKLAIIQVEDWKGKDGPKGEKGRLQFTEARWRELTLLPFHLANRAALTRDVRFQVDTVETKHITDLMTKIYSLGKRPTVYLIAEMHAAGFEPVRSGKVKAAKKDFASRVDNIYSER